MRTLCAHIVQWIERGIPKPQIQVRFLVWAKYTTMLNFLSNSKEREPQTHQIFLDPETMRGHGFTAGKGYLVKVISANEEGGKWAEGDIYIREQGTRLRLNDFSRNQDIQAGDHVIIQKTGGRR